MMCLTSQRVSAQAETEKRSFDVSAGYAINTLKEAAQQAGVDFIFSADLVRGVMTSSIHGNYAPLEAFSLMLAETKLTVYQHEKTGVFAISKALDVEGPQLDHQPQQETEMNKNKTPFGKLLSGLVSIAVATFPAAAQEAEEEIFELSPFSVSADDTNGYVANSSLSGSRLKTDLRNLAASISVFTEDFMEDTDSNDLEDLLVYAGNAEVAGASGNFLGLEVDNQGVRNGVRLDGQQNRLTRVRGLAGADLTREFFGTQVTMDAYNSERVEINRGANSILFGTGSPAGIINTSLKKAYMTNSNAVEVAVGNEGSHRGVVDFQRMLVDNKLAFRVIGLFDETQYRQEPSFDRDKRIFTTTTYKPFKNTTFRFTSENGSRELNPVNPVGPVDSFSTWWDYGQPTYNTFEERSNGNKFRSAGASTQPGFFWQVAGIWDSTQPDPILTGFQGLRRAADVEDPDQKFNIGFFGSGRSEEFTPNRASNYLQQHITDLNVFDYSKKKLVGDFARTNEHFEVYTATLEQLFLDGNAGFELVYNDEAWSRDTNYMLQQNNNDGRIWLDLSEVLPDGRQNPNVGRPFMMVGADGYDVERWGDGQDRRATAFLRHDFAEMLNGWMGNVLGTHTFTGLVSSRQTEAMRVQYRTFWDSAGTDIENHLNARGASFRMNANSLVYLGPSVLGTASPQEIQINPFQHDVRLKNNRITTMIWNRRPAADGGQNWEEVTLGGVRRPINMGLTPQEIDSEAFIWQGSWLDTHLHTVLGWRTDDIKTWDDTQPRDGTRLNLLVPSEIDRVEPPRTDSGDTFTLSGVLRWPHRWMELPKGVDLSAHYVDSENFRPGTANRVNIFDEGLGAEQGVTEEYGFTLSLAENKFSARFNWYETSIVNGSLTLNSGNPFSRLILIVNEQANSLVEEDPNITAAQQNEFFDAVFSDFVLSELNAETVTNNAGGIEVTSFTGFGGSDTEDFVSKGFELDLVWNPTRNWRLLFNAARQEAIRTNIAPAWTRYFNEILFPVLEGPLGGLPSRTLSTQQTPFNPVRSEPVLNQNIIAFRTSKAVENTVAPELREWRANLVTNYTFDEGSVLDGWSVGGALRWQDDIAIGYPLVPVEPGSTALVSDIANPYIGDTELNTDIWLGYQTKIMDGKVNWKLQLNVRNVFADEDEVIPVATQPDGVLRVARFTPPTTWTLSSRFEF